VDPARQHALHHKGADLSVVGPLNISRSPQGQPVIFQAGNSGQGRDLGAAIGEGIFTHAASIEAGQAFYTDIKSRAAAKGRNPDHIVVMPGVKVFRDLAGGTPAQVAGNAAGPRVRRVF
jgi:alkanesulfonate monooxygenase SsuD/methylene tetrahydromethanopterin reductase-like flavin-dependent oxidoreductase (luciferase family)